MSRCDENGFPTDPNHPWNRHCPTESIEEFADRRLAECGRAYAEGNLGAMHDGLHWCEQYHRPMPSWLSAALRDVVQRDLKGQKSGRRGRQAKWLRQYTEDMRDFARYEAVQECVDHGVPWLHAYYAASLILEGDFGEASEDAIEKSYKRVVKRTKENPRRYYILSSVRMPRPAIGPRPKVWAEINRLKRQPE